jgi:hypothetical protein
MVALRRYGPDLVIILLAIVLQRFAFDPSWIEDGYANGVYAALAQTLVPMTNALPFTLTDLIFGAIILGFVAMWIVRLRRARGRRLIVLGELLLRTAAIAAVLAIWFDAAWGLNYRRAPVIARVAYDDARVTTPAVAAFAKSIVAELNATAPAAHLVHESDAEMREHLAAAFEPVVARLGDRWSVVVSRPKTSFLLDRWFAMAGIGGMWNPFSYETILNSEFLPFERPFALSHEWGHVAGFGDESDANLIAALTCLRSPDPFVRYSGLFWTYGFLPDDVRRDLAVSPLVLGDLRAAQHRFLQHYEAQLFTIQWFTYDKFLKANRVNAGVVSYSLFVRTIVGTPRDRDGLPLLREH